MVGFGLVLIPAGMDFFFRRPERGKRGTGTIVTSILPSAVIFLIVIAVLPLDTVFRVLAIVCEVAGMAMYGWAMWGHTQRAAGSTRASRVRRG